MVEYEGWWCERRHWGNPVSFSGAIYTGGDTVLRKEGKRELKKKKLVCCCCLQPHGLQHARLPYPSNSCPLSRRRFLTISSSAALFFCLQKTSYNLLSLRDSKDKKVYICLRKVETGVLSSEEGSGMEGGRGPVGRSWVIRINMLCCGKEKTDSKSFSFGLDIRR